MNKEPFVIDVRPVRSEIISPKELLDLSKKSPGLIERAEFVPPRMGSRDFGRFRVRYSRPRLRSFQFE